MTIVFIVLGIFFALILGAVFLFFLNKSLAPINELKAKLQSEHERAEADLHTLELTRVRIEKSEQSFERTKDTLEKTVENLRHELEKSQRQSADTEMRRVKDTSEIKSAFVEYKTVTQSLKESTDNLRNVLSNNQLRGKFGQEVAENLLKSVGFVKGENYFVEQTQESVSTRPDFTILLPDKTKVNIDAKFPLDSFLKYTEALEAGKEMDKKRYLADFTSDVRQKVRQVTTRDYINPQENTVDFVILFVPNEMLFSFIYEHLNDVWNDAMQKKVVLAGPFSFTAILRMMFQSYKNFTYQKNIFQVIKLFHQFEKEYEKYNEEFDILGKRLQGVSSQYELVSGTRTKKLSSVVEKIKNAGVLEEGGGDPEKIRTVVGHDREEDV